MQPDRDDAGSILLIANEAAMPGTLADYLRAAGFRVVHAADAAQGLRRAGAGGHDVAVVDLSQDPSAAADLCRQLKRVGGGMPVLLVGSAEPPGEECDATLAKPFALQALEECVRALVAHRKDPIATEVLQIADLVLDTATQRVHRGGRELQLSPIGIKLLTILMRESPRVVGRREIEREIWGDALPDSDTLRSHLYNLRKAIDRPFERPLLHTIHSAGYRLAELERETSARSA